MSTATILVTEKKNRKVALISIAFSYGLLGLIVSATPSDEILFDLTRISISGSLLATFLGLTDPVNRLAKWVMPKMFGTPDSVTWTLDTMMKMPTLMKEKVDLTPSTERIKEWAKNSYYSPYLSGFRFRIVSEVYFGIGLLIIAAGSFLPVQMAFASTLIRSLLIPLAVITFVSLGFHFLELIEKAHIVAVFEMMITFGIPLKDFGGLRGLLMTGNWSEARSWMLRELHLPLAPWHWITLEPRYGKVLLKLRELEDTWGYLREEETETKKMRLNLTKLSGDLKSIASIIAEKIGVKKDEKDLLELTTIFFEKGMISKPLHEGIQILEQLRRGGHSDEALHVIGRPLLIMGQKMKEELRKVAEKD